VIVSDTTANAGTISTYTSGCPNTQKRCCQNSTSPPNSAEKNTVLNTVSDINIIRPAVSEGREARRRNETVAMDTTNIVTAAPGDALVVANIPMKLTDVAVEDVPFTSNVPVRPNKDMADSDRMEVERGGYNTQPSPARNSPVIVANAATNDNKRITKDPLLIAG
jgi:hypothetical protein